MLEIDKPRIKRMNGPTLFNPKLQPFSEMPVWARLQFSEMVPRSCFYADTMLPRSANEASVTGFERFGDIIWIYYKLPWPDKIERDWVWPAVKMWMKPSLGVSVLNPLDVPTTFAEPRDGRSYHACYNLTHTHHIPFPFVTCSAPGCWVWEEKYDNSIIGRKYL